MTYQCQKKMTPQYARSIAETENLCYKCVQPWFPGHTCTIKCSICGQGHNSLLCEHKFQLRQRWSSRAPRFNSPGRNQFNPRPQGQYQPESGRRSNSNQSRGFQQRRDSSTPRTFSYGGPQAQPRSPPNHQRERQLTQPRNQPDNRKRSSSAVSFRNPVVKPRSSSQTSTPNKKRPKQKAYNITTPSYK